MRKPVFEGVGVALVTPDSRPRGHGRHQGEQRGPREYAVCPTEVPPPRAPERRRPFLPGRHRSGIGPVDPERAPWVVSVAAQNMIDAILVGRTRGAHPDREARRGG